MGTIHLTMYPYTEEIRKHYEVKPEKVGKNSVREVTVHGESAVLLNGLWSSKIYKTYHMRAMIHPKRLPESGRRREYIMGPRGIFLYPILVPIAMPTFLTPEQAVRIANQSHKGIQIRSQ